MTVLASFPANPRLFLHAGNVDGLSNAMIAHGEKLVAWKSQGVAGVADFIPGSTASAFLKSDSNEQTVAFDGVLDVLVAAGSKVPLNFFHRTGLFDLILVFRRRGGSIESVLRNLLGPGQYGLTISMIGYFQGEEGQLKASLIADTGTMAALTTTLTTPPGELVKVLVRGTGVGGKLRMSKDFYHFEETAYAFAPGTVDSNRDYAIGTAGELAPAVGSLFEGDLRLLAAYDRNLVDTELLSLKSVLTGDVGAGI